jgi:hypothetical protein
MLYHLNPRDEVRPALEPPVGPQRLTVTQHQYIISQSSTC